MIESLKNFEDEPTKEIDDIKNSRNPIEYAEYRKSNAKTKEEKEKWEKALNIFKNNNPKSPHQLYIENMINSLKDKITKEDREKNSPLFKRYLHWQSELNKINKPNNN